MFRDGDNFKAFHDCQSHDATNRLPTTQSPPSGEYIKEFDRRGEKIKEKKVRDTCHKILLGNDLNLRGEGNSYPRSCMRNAWITEQSAVL